MNSSSRELDRAPASTSNSTQSEIDKQVDIPFEIFSENLSQKSLVPLNRPVANFSASINRASDNGASVQKDVSPSDLETVVLLDPALVSVDSTPNRMPSSFHGEEFEYLCASIAASRGNTQPIGVVPRGQRGDESPDQQTYELIYGERRLRACIENNLLVKAIIYKTSNAGEPLDKLLENACRKDLAPIEFARQVQHILAADKTMTLGRLALKVGRDKSLLSRAVELAKVPDILIGAFASPQDIRYSDAPKLNAAWNANPADVEVEVLRIRAEEVSLKATEVVARLTDAATRASENEGVAPCNTAPIPLKVGSETVGQISILKGGKTQIQLTVNLPEKHREAVAAQIAALIERKLPKKPAQTQPISHASNQGASDKTQNARSHLAQSSGKNDNASGEVGAV